MSSTEMEASDSMIFQELSQMSDDQMARVYDMLHDAKQRVVKKEAEERENPVLYERSVDYVRNIGPYMYPPSSLYL